jgi:quercetin dioxygenase-like cupin family protein
MTALIGSTANPVRISGVHGGEGQLRWQCFARLHMLHVDLLAFEYARLEVQSEVGDHVHTRTEEIYFIVSGHGEMRVNGEVGTVGPGDVILSPRDTRHGLAANQGESIEFIVLEVLAPQVVAGMPKYSPDA